MKSNDLRPGMALNNDGQLFIVRKTEHVKPGKGPAYVQVKLKSVTTGAVSEKRLRAGEEVNQVNLDRRDMEYLYADATGHVFMDQESFDQTTIPGDLIEDQMVYIKPNTVISVQMFEGKPVSVELPAAVDLLVTETAPQVKGATATNQLKEAELETGLKTRVPPFIENGEMIRVNTEDGSYISRAGE
jgi:elongation factor P